MARARAVVIVRRTAPIWTEVQTGQSWRERERERGLGMIATHSEMLNECANEKADFLAFG